MKKHIIYHLIVFLGLSNVAKSQFIDSAAVQYNAQQSELTVYLEGWLLWSSYAGITKFIATEKKDTVFVDTYFMPCQTFSGSLDYDTTYVANILIIPGQKVVKLVNLLDTILGVAGCRHNPDGLVRLDSTYLNLFVPLGWEEQNLPQFKVSPNPVHSYLQLDIPEGEKITGVTITDVFGRTIQNLKLENNEIDCSSLANGLYFLTLTTSRGTQVWRFSKND